MRLLEVGEIVEYYSRRYDPEPSHVGKVLESLPKGIPSYPHPMVKLEGKAGYLSAEHCMPAKVTRNAVDPNVCEHGVNTLMSGLCNKCSEDTQDGVEDGRD